MFPIGNMADDLITTASPTELGALLRDVRRARGLRQEDLALAAGVGRRFIGELENGKATVRLGETLRVAAALGVEVGVLLERSDARG
jgi:y4mF family transcriptional regulator